MKIISDAFVCLIVSTCLAQVSSKTDKAWCYFFFIIVMLILGLQLF